MPPFIPGAPMSSPAPSGGVPIVDRTYEASDPIARYKSTEEMAAEFGDYKVNQKTENLCDSTEPYPIDPTTNDPYRTEANNAPDA